MWLVITTLDSAALETEWEPALPTPTPNSFLQVFI